MNMHRIDEFEGGATLIVGLIMLAVITLMVTGAFTLSNTNLKAVGNMQFRDEATAAANLAIEQLVTSFTTAVPVAQNIQVDLNNDGVTDYTVAITPTCIGSSVVAEPAAIGFQGSEELPGLSVGGTSSSNFRTLWNIDALVTDSVSGARVRVHHGVRKILTADCT